MLPPLAVTPLSAQSQPEQDRRRSPRWRLEFPVACVRPTDNQERQGQAADLSAGGIGCVFADDACELGSAMRVRFTLPAAKASFELDGVVKSAGGGRIGIQFSEVNDAKAARLLAAIFQQIASVNRPELAEITDLGALEERLVRIENAISLVSSAIKRESLEEEAEALRALIEAKKKAMAVLAS